MLGTRNPRIKICCISSIEEARMAIRFGSSALGLVSQMPSGPGVIPDNSIIDIVKVIPPPIASFLLTSELISERIIAQQRQFRANTLQLVDEVEVSVYIDLKKELPGINIVQVVHVRDKSSIDYAIKVSEYSDALLLDSGNPSLEIKELGGTGKVHDWTISRRIRELVKIPVFLAGGLNPGNVRRAIETVEPFGVDVCSGVRTNSTLNPKKLLDFFNAVNSVILQSKDIK